MDGSQGHRKTLPFPNRSAKKREEILPAVEKIVMIRPDELVIIYSHRSPVSICADDAYSLYLFLQTPSDLRYDEFKAAISNDLEDTQAA